LKFQRASYVEQHEHFPFLIELRDYHFTCEAEPEVNSLIDYARYRGETMGYGIDDEWLSVAELV
jgi:hypothetical protein